MTRLWNPAKAEHTGNSQSIAFASLLYSWTNHRLHHYNKFPPLCLKVFFYIIPEWPCFLETYSSCLLVSYQHPSLRLAGFYLRGSHPQYLGDPFLWITEVVAMALSFKFTSTYEEANFCFFIWDWVLLAVFFVCLFGGLVGFFWGNETKQNQTSISIINL